MKIVMVANQFPKFSETFIVGKFLQLCARRWDVHVVCRRSDPAQWQLFPELQTSQHLHERIHVTTDTDAALTRIGPDLVHFEFGMLALGRMHVKQTTGCRIVVSFRGTDLHTNGIDDPGWYDDIWSAADAVHVLSEDLWRRALARGCPAQMPHQIIPPAVDLGALEPARPRHTEPAGLPDRPLRILSVGRLAWIKGYAHALQAVRLLEQMNIACEYRIIGEGEGRPAVVFDIHDLDLQHTVQLLGPLPHTAVLDQLRWADVLLHPALCEGYCNAVLEAQAARVPVVCSDGGALKENVLDGVTGLVAPRRDAAALADRLACLARDAALRQRLAEAGHERVAAEFRADEQVTRFETLYRAVLDRVQPSRGAAAAASNPVAEHAVADASPVVAGSDQGSAALVHAIRRDVRALPRGSAVAVVSRGDDELLSFNGLRAAHFPQLEDGTYAGYHPGTSEEAIEHLESLRRSGIEYLLFPATSLWWLSHYTGFAAHLDRHYRRMPDSTAACVVFDLTRTGAQTRDRAAVAVSRA